MTSKEAYEKIERRPFQGGQDFLRFAAFNAGWKAALDEAIIACQLLQIAEYSNPYAGKFVRLECIRAIGDLK